jgi:DNA-binding response OmpR family regulator
MSKVVVIDDEKFILMMIEDKLKSAGINVVINTQSVGAVELIRKEKPDLVVLDWMMPEISGIEVCRQLKADPELKDIPVFMLTAKGQQEDEERGMKLGVLKYIIKPFSPKTLLEDIKNVIG